MQNPNASIPKHIHPVIRFKSYQLWHLRLHTQWERAHKLRLRAQKREGSTDLSEHIFVSFFPNSWQFPQVNSGCWPSWLDSMAINYNCIAQLLLTIQTWFANRILDTGSRNQPTAGFLSCNNRCRSFNFYSSNRSFCGMLLVNNDKVVGKWANVLNYLASCVFLCLLSLSRLVKAVPLQCCEVEVLSA